MKSRSHYGARHARTKTMGGTTFNSVGPFSEITIPDRLKSAKHRKPGCGLAPKLPGDRDPSNLTTSFGAEALDSVSNSAFRRGLVRSSILRSLSPYSRSFIGIGSLHRHSNTLAFVVRVNKSV